MSLTEKIIIILMCIIGTLITRFLPFLLFPDNKKTPEFIIVLSDRLPYAMMGMLVVYCLKDTTITNIFPTIIAVFITVLLHFYKRNTLLSVSVATLVYMILIRIL